MDETLVVAHKVLVTLPVLDTEIVGLTEVVVHPDTEPVKEALGVLDTVRVLVWNALSDGLAVKEGLKDGVRVLEPQEVVVILEVKECEPDTVVVTDELKDGVRVPVPQALVVPQNVEV